MALVKHTVDPLHFKIAGELWQHLSDNVAALESGAHLRYYSYQTKTHENCIEKDNVKYSVLEFVEQEILPKLGMNIDIVPYMGNFFCQDDGQKLITISWWIEDGFSYWLVLLTG